MVDPNTGMILDESDLAQTAGSIAFVNEGDRVLFNLKDPVKFTKLREKLDRVKDGRDVVLESVEDWDAYVENL